MQIILFIAAVFPGWVCDDQIEGVFQRKRVLRQTTFEKISLDDDRGFDRLFCRPKQRGKKRSLTDFFLELLNIHRLEFLEKGKVQAKSCYPASIRVDVH